MKQNNVFRKIGEDEKNYVVRDLYKKGFAILPEVLTSEGLERICKITDPIIRYVTLEHNPEQEKINFEKIITAKKPEIIVDFSSKFANLITTILNSENAFLSYEQIMVVRAKSNYVTRKHRDIDGGKEPMSEASLRDKRSIHLWIPLTNVCKNSSCLYVQPWYEENTALEIKMKAGDVLFLHNYVWHGSYSNKSDIHRQSRATWGYCFLFSSRHLGTVRVHPEGLGQPLVLLGTERWGEGGSNYQDETGVDAVIGQRLKDAFDACLEYMYSN